MKEIREREQGQAVELEKIGERRVSEEEKRHKRKIRN